MSTMQAVRLAVAALVCFVSASLTAAEETPAGESKASVSAQSANAENPSAPSPTATSTNAIVATNSVSQTVTVTNEAPLMIDVRVKLEGGVGQIPSSRAYITVGTNRFAFLVPGGFKVDTSDPERITLVRPDSACIISLRIHEPTSEHGLTPTECREKITKEHPACSIDGEFSLAAGDSSGPAFEIRWKAQGIRRSARLAYVPFRAGVIEFCLDSNPEKFGAMQTFLNDIMLTFRASDPSGKIAPTPIYDRI